MGGESLKNPGEICVKKSEKVPKPARLFPGHTWGNSPVIEKSRKTGIKVYEAHMAPLRKKDTPVLHPSLKLKVTPVILMVTNHIPEVIGTLGHLDGSGIVVETPEDAEKYLYRLQPEK